MAGINCCCIYSLYRFLVTHPPVAGSPFNGKGKQMTDKLFEQTKPQCVGRYLFDVPVTFNNAAVGQVKINEMRITSKRLYPPAFIQRIRLREEELNNSPTVDSEDLPYLKQAYRIQLREQALRDATNKPGNRPENAPFLKEVILLSDGKGAIFDHNESGTPDIYRQLEAHVYSGMIAFVITTDIRDFSDKKHSEKKPNI